MAVPKESYWFTQGVIKVKVACVGVTKTCELRLLQVVSWCLLGSLSRFTFDMMDLFS